MKKGKSTGTAGKSKSIDNAEEENFPGYPHYPQSEDILNAGTTKVPIDVENISRQVDINTNLHAGKMKNEIETDSTPPPATPEGKVKLVTGNDADVTEDDLAALDDLGLSPDEGDDELLRQRTYRAQMGDSDLDIPGADLDDDDEAIGSEDEENNYYSLGGDAHDNLENQN